MTVAGDELLHYFDHCVEVCAAEFGRPAASLPPRFTVVLDGDVPEFRHLAQGVSRITLHRDATPWQARYQAGHEVFHWLCTPAGLYHWTHELLAVELALRCIAGSGIEGAEVYVGREEARLDRAADGVTLDRVLTTPLVPSYPWVYGRVFVTGRALQAAVGWERVKSLAVVPPDVRGWLQALPADARAGAVAVLGEPTDDWV